MASTGALRRGRPELIAGLLGLLPVSLVLLATPRGLWLSPDSVVYVSTYRVFAASGDVAFSALWAPGLPALVLLIGPGAAVAVNCAAVFFNTFVTYRLAHEVSGSQALSLLVTAATAVSMASAFVFSWLWSEPVFCLAVNLALIVLVRIHKSGRVTVSRIAGLVVAVNVACLFRYAGMVLLPLVAMALLWVPGTPVQRMRRSVVGSALAGLGLFGVMLVNVWRGQEATGPRLPSERNVVGVVSDLASTVSSYLFNGVAASVVLGLIMMLVVAALAARQLWCSGLLTVLSRPVVVLWVWLIVYLGFMLVSQLFTFIDPLGFRLLAPVQTAGLTVTAVLVAEHVRKPSVVRLVKVASVVYLVVSLAITVAWVDHVRPNGYGITALARDYPEAGAVVDASVPRTATVFSNVPSLLVYLTGRDLVAGYPDAGPMPTDRPVWDPRDEFRGERPGDYVVWFGSRNKRPTWRTVRSGVNFAVYEVRGLG